MRLPNLWGRGPRATWPSTVVAWWAGILVALAAVSPWGESAEVSETASSAGTPNVLLILADDLGFSDLGCYGGEILTPHLDDLAANGLRFSQFYNSGRCWPTRGSMLTGYYPHSIRRDRVPGVRSGGQGRRPDWAPLICRPLSAAGYRCYHSGKWHIDGMPIAEGFDRSYYLKDQHRFFSPTAHWEDDEPLPAVDPESGYYGTVAVADHAIRCLREHALDHRDRPFFHYLAFAAPHFPLHALPEDIDRYRDTYVDGWDETRRRRHGRLRSLGVLDAPLSKVMPEVGPPYHFPDAIEALGEGEVNRPLPWQELTSVQREFQAIKMSIHAAMVDRMDREIGRVLDQIREMGRWENTLVLFLSDNGGSAEIMVRGDGHDPRAAPGSWRSHLCLGPGWSTVSNTPFRYHKTWVHEGGTATPLIAHWPAGIAARGEIRRAVGHVIDVWPTLLELAGRPAAHPPDGPPRPGRSIVAAFAGEPTSVGRSADQRTLWWEHEGNRALRHGDWKIAAAGPEAAWELYRSDIDRAETDDLASRHPDKVRELADRWERIMDEQAALAKAESLSEKGSDPL